MTRVTREFMIQRARPLTAAEQLMLARAPKRPISDIERAAAIFLGKATPEPTLFDRAARAWPKPSEPPQTYDRRTGHGSMEAIDMSRLRPGDAVLTDGADVRMTTQGPVVHLKSGFETGRSAGRTGPILTPVAPPGVSVDQNIEIARGRAGLPGVFWFRRQVPNRGPWDYKQLGPEYEAFGNFNYGATGREVGFPTAILDQEAGRAQGRDRTGRDEWGVPGPILAPFVGSGSYGDDPVDQFWINQGARYRDGRGSPE